VAKLMQSAVLIVTDDRRATGEQRQTVTVRRQRAKERGWIQINRAIAKRKFDLRVSLRLPRAIRALRIASRDNTVWCCPSVGWMCAGLPSSNPPPLPPPPLCLNRRKPDRKSQ
jgi:hypothetical protein